MTRATADTDDAPAAAHAEPPFDSNAEILPARPKRDKSGASDAGGGDGDGAPSQADQVSSTQSAARGGGARGADGEGAGECVGGGGG